VKEIEKAGFIRLRQNTPWFATGMNRRCSKGAMASQDGEANLGEVRQMTDEDGLAQAPCFTRALRSGEPVEFCLACATDSTCLWRIAPSRPLRVGTAGSFILEHKLLKTLLHDKYYNEGYILNFRRR